MAARYSDREIMAFLEEKKPLPKDFRSKLHPRPKRMHSEQRLEIQGEGGNHYRLIIRQSRLNPFDFSIILALCPPNSNQVFRLRRYNGKSHEHTNTIEGDRFYAYHVHTATERYQELGAREDAYAEPSDRFSDFNAALNCMLSDCGFDVPQDPQMKLFKEV